MSRVTRLTAVLILIILTLGVLTTILSQPKSGSEERSAEVLIQNATRLKELAEYKLSQVNSFLSTTTINTALESTLELISSCIEEGDYNLSRARELYASGNYTEAKVYAIYSIRCYGEALKLLSEVVSELGIEVGSPKAGKTHLANRNGSIIVAYNRSREFLNRLRDIIDRLTEEGVEYDFSYILNELNSIEELINEGISLASQGKVNESGPLLGKVRSRLALVNAELRRISAAFFVYNIKKKILSKKYPELSNTNIEELLEEIKKDIHGKAKLKRIFNKLISVVNTIEKVKHGQSKQQGKKKGVPGEGRSSPQVPPNSKNRGKQSSGSGGT